MRTRRHASAIEGGRGRWHAARPLAIGLVMFAVAAVLPGAEPVGVALGLIAPPSEVTTPSQVRGVQLAIEEANARDPSSVRLELRSENGQWGTVGNDAVVLVCQRRVDALITPPDGADAHLILQVSGRTRVPVASLCGDRSVAGAGVPWAVQVVPRNDRQAVALFRDGPPAGRWCAVVPTGRAGRSIAADLAVAATEAGVTLNAVVETSAGPGAGNASPILGADADGVLLWLPPAEAGALAATLRAAGFTGRIAGPCQLNAPAFAASAGAAAADVRVVRVQALDPRPVAIAFARAYRQRYGEAPDFTAAAAYDAARVLIAVLCGRDPRPVYRRFPPERVPSGATGPMHFDANGDRSDPLEVGSAAGWPDA